MRWEGKGGWFPGKCYGIWRHSEWASTSKIPMICSLLPRTSANGLASLWYHSGLQDRSHRLLVLPTTSSVGKVMWPPFHPWYLAGKQRLSSERVRIKPVFHFKSRCWAEDHGTWLEALSRLRNSLLPICIIIALSCVFGIYHHHSVTALLYLTAPD